ncbi:hypothetical protein EV121DRAFT_274580 [Schizophyllum commune]
MVCIHIAGKSLASYVHPATSSTPVPIRATTSSSLGHISLLKRLAAVPVGALPVRAPRAMSRCATSGYKAIFPIPDIETRSISLRDRAAGGTRAHPSSDGSEGGGPLHPHTSPSYRRLPLISIFSQTPNRRRRARGP